MILTRIWTLVLAFLAIAFLACMFVLSVGATDGFTPADRNAIQATTEAGAVALAAEIHAAPVSRASVLLTNLELREALKPDSERGRQSEKFSLEQLQNAFTRIAQSMLLADYPQISVALMDKDKQIVARTGIADELMDEVIKLEIVSQLPADQEQQFAATLGNLLHVVKVSRADNYGFRLLGIQELNLEAGSFVRQVLGTDHPAGIVRGNQLVGSIIGDQPVSQELIALTQAHFADTPSSGASEVFRVGEGLDARIGAIARIPGPAGVGADGAGLVVLSANTAAAGQTDLASALLAASRRGLFARVNWLILFGLMVVFMALSIYLPNLEYISPLRRLTNEFKALLAGKQQQIFYDTYAGAIGELAKAAVAYQEVLRANALDIDHEEEDTRRKTIHTQSLQLKRSVRQNRISGVNRELSAEPTAKPQEQVPTSAKEAYYRQLFQEFIAAKQENNESIDNLIYEKFAAKLAANTETLLKNPEVKDVKFVVYLKEGKVALKARPIRS